MFVPVSFWLKRWSLLGLLLLAGLPATAQQVWLRQFGPAEGLAAPFVYALAQDAPGYLWLGTAEGLLRFDGRSFVAFTRKDGLREDFVTSLWADPRTGALWAGHYGGGFSVCPQPGDKFRPAAAGPPGLAAHPAPDTAALGRYQRRFGLRFPADVVPQCLLEDRAGNAWFGTAGQGLWRHSDRALRHLAGAARPGPGPLPADRRLPAGVTVTAWVRANWSAAYWVGTAADGLFCLPPVGAARHYTTANGLLHNSVSALLADATGRLWVGTRGTGLAYFDESSGSFVRQRLPPVPLDITGFANDAEGGVWVGTEGQGLYYTHGGGKWQHVGAAAGLPNAYIYGLVALPGGNLLLTHGQGLTLLRNPANPRFRSLAAPDNPLVRGLLPGAALAADGRTVAVPTRTGTLVVDLPRALAAAAPQPPGLALAGAEVDGAAAAPTTLGELPAGPHRVSFALRGISLAPTADALQYQYRLLGLDNHWSRPSAAPDAQFPGLGPGRYRLQARARQGTAGPWSPVVAAAFSIATPFWRTGWFLGLLALSAAGLGWGLLRWREGRLRQVQYVLERTVRERTNELRRQKAHIEEINGDLVIARDAAEASQRAKAQFLANMSHEIRTPMNAVVGLTNLLQATHPTTEQHEYLTAIESSSQNLLVIINDILDSSKMEAGKLTLEQVPFRLPEAVRRLGAMFKFATESKDLYLRIEVAPAVPAAVFGDPVRLHQILVNLVGNAIKFTRQGGVTLTVEALEPPNPSPASPLPASPAHQVIRFTVRDTGIGIAADKLGAIFEDFSQANTSTTREFGGTGLGLSIARNLVQLHGGQLGVTSTEGEGSAFFFAITYAVADARAAQPEGQVGPLPPFVPALRVLVAEDNALNQLVARKTLEAWNVQVVIADNGRLAVEAAAAQPFDAVLMDVQMPEMDGYEATRQIRRHFPDTGRLPIIGLTASVLPEDRQVALSAGMNDTLAKPFEPAVLYARLAHFTGRTAAGETAAAAESHHARHQALPEGQRKPSTRHQAPDWTLLEELAGGNAAFLGQIVSTFLHEAPALEELLHTTLAHDHELLARTAHKLKGQVAYFGLPRLHAQLDELERTARQPDCPHCEPLVAAIRQQLADLYPQLSERLEA